MRPVQLLERILYLESNGEKGSSLAGDRRKKSKILRRKKKKLERREERKNVIRPRMSVSGICYATSTRNYDISSESTGHNCGVPTGSGS